jgi:hypothetical protein
MKQATLGYLIERLERLPQDAVVCYDFVYLMPKGIHSYRGYYEQLALGYTDEGESPKVSELLTLLKDANGKTFTGYKGGEYTMGDDTKMWVANRRQAGGTAIIDAVEHRCYVILTTAKID